MTKIDDAFSEYYENFYIIFKNYVSNNFRNKMKTVLMVAEKPSLANSIATILSK